MMRKCFNGLVYFILMSIVPLSSCEASDEVDSSSFVPEFSIMIIPDIQNYTYTDERFKYLNAISEYYHSNKDKFGAVFQVGDLTNNNVTWQYTNAYEQCLGRFIPEDQLVFCLGNHDYGNGGSSDIRMSEFPEEMMPPYDLRMNGSKWENFVRYIKLGGKKYGVLVLEFCARDKALEWADSVISSDPLTPYIILTHIFLDQNGEMFDDANPNVENKGSSNKKYQMGDEYKNDSREIFDKIIYNNPNVKLVFCGHCLTPSYINVHSENNVEDKPVHMIEVNYQHYAEGGLGFVGILDVKGDTYRIRSYSTYERKYGSTDNLFGTLN